MFIFSLFEIIGKIIATAKMQFFPCIGQALEHNLSTGQSISPCFLPGCCMGLGYFGGCEMVSPRGTIAHAGKSPLDTPPIT